RRAVATRGTGVGRARRAWLQRRRRAGAVRVPAWRSFDDAREGAGRGVTADALPFADVELARRLERAEGTANARFVEARAHVLPERGGCWIEVGGAEGVFGGAGARRQRAVRR